jgi:type IV pilus assembly protein PilC
MSRKESDLATATRPIRKDSGSKEQTSTGKARTRAARSCAEKCAPAAKRWSRRRCGVRAILVTKVKKRSFGRGGKVTEKDITLFTRQLATMMKAGVPLLQAFDIVGKGAANGGRPDCWATSSSRSNRVPA